MKLQKEMYLKEQELIERDLFKGTGIERERLV